MVLTTEHMPLLERLRKGANCVIFLDGAPEPAADVADMLCKAADKIEQLERSLKDTSQMEYAQTKKIEQMRVALKYGRDCVMESFEHANGTDDQVMAEARLKAIDEALRP